MKSFVCFVLCCIFCVSTLYSAPAVPPVPLLPQGYAFDREPSYESAPDGIDFTFYDANEHRRSLPLAGELWRFTIHCDHESSLFDDFLSTLKKEGPNVLGATEKLHVLEFPVNENEKIYYSIERRWDDLSIRVVREKVIAAGETLTLNFTPEVKTLFFNTKMESGQFYCLNTDIGDLQNVRVYSQRRVQKPEYSSRMYFNTNFSKNHGSLHMCYAIPQLPGRTAYKFENNGKTTGTVTVSLQKIASTTEYPRGTKTGALIVKGVSWGRVQVENEYFDSIDTPGFDRTSKVGDFTPEGDALMWLPAGMWKVSTIPYKSGVRVSQCRLVPVHEGQITTVNFPPSLTRAFAPTTDGRLEILSVTGDGISGLIETGVVDSVASDVTVLTTSNTKLFEDGTPCEITSVSPIDSPVDIVLLLDSSGSMKGSMRQAVASVKSFIGKLPDNYNVRVIDFDTTPKPLVAKTREELLKGLNSVIARGATCLFDSIILGLNTLADSKRSALLVFTDGVDANWNDTKPGSKATKPQVLAKAKELSVPIYTIGFGKNPDVDTLTRIAAIGHGAYYNATSKDALDEVFSRISTNLSSRYSVAFQRPKKAGLSTQPVVSLTVDNSGSMDMPPTTSGCDYRIERVRQILKGFVEAMPSDLSSQLITFTSDVNLAQVLTSDKDRLLRALATMKGDGGTNILESVRSSLHSLSSIPSSRRYMVYITDAALKVNPQDQKEFDILLGKIKDAGIVPLWVGICPGDEGRVFEHAAKLSGGKAVVSTDLNTVSQAIDDIAKVITNQEETQVPSNFRLEFKKRLENGRNLSLSAQTRKMLPPRESSVNEKKPRGVEVTVAGELKPYSGEISRLLSGDDEVVRDVRIQKRMQLNVTKANSAVKIDSKEAIFLTRLRGLDTPSRMRYLALSLELENILPEQKVAVYRDGSGHPASVVGDSTPVRYETKIPSYVIPDLKKHLFLRINNSQTIPLSDATYLAEEPLCLPKDPGLCVHPQKAVSGTVVFLVPSDTIEQFSLHLFDTAYGHIDIPLSGTMEYTQEDYGKLSGETPVKLSEAFSMKVAGFRDVQKIDTVEAGEDCVFRIVEVDLTSNVQSHLKITPSKIVSYRLNTHRGELVFNLHRLTERVPLGLYEKSFVVPGSSNRFRFVFRIPSVLAKGKYRGALMVDLVDGPKKILLSPDGAGVHLPSPTATGQGVKLYVHDYGVTGYGDLAVEVSVEDEADDLSTAPGELFILKKSTVNEPPAGLKERNSTVDRLAQAVNAPSGLGSFGGGDDESFTQPYGPDIIVPRIAAEKYMFALDQSSVIDDGTVRRGIYFYKLPSGAKISDYHLSSFVIDGFDIPLKDEKKYENKVLLLQKIDSYKLESVDRGFARNLAVAVGKIQQQRRASGFVKAGTLKGGVTDLSSQSSGMTIDCPMWSASGKDALSDIDDIAKLAQALSSLFYVPSKESPFRHIFSRQAVFTQGWYTENEAAAFADSILRKQGHRCERISVELTDDGKKELQSLTKVPVDLYKLPALRYTDGEFERILVLPFFRHLKDLSGLVKYDDRVDIITYAPQTSRISVSVGVLPAGASKNANAADASSSLTGGSSSVSVEYQRLLSVECPLWQLSNDAVDIGYALIPDLGAGKIAGLIDTPSGRTVSDRSIDLSRYRIVSEKIEITTPQKSFTIDRPLEKDEDICARFHTIAINVPDFTQESVDRLDALRKNARNEGGSPNELSALRWYSRSAIARFVASQCNNERHLSGVLDVVVARRQKLRVISVHSTIAKDGEFTATMDLLQSNPEFASGSQENRQAFNIQAGFFDTRLEGKALPHGKSVYDIWDMAPEGTRIVPLMGETRDNLLVQLKKMQAPESMIKRLEYTYDIIFFPSCPSYVDGKMKWAWLQVDRNTFETTSCFDTGEHGAMADYVLEGLLNDVNQFLMGAWKGIEGSLWAVSAFSLRLDNYDEILKAAQAYCGVIGNGAFGWSEGNPSGMQVGLSTGSIVPNVSFNDFKVDINLLGGPRLNPNQNVFGWQNGWKAGVALYFQAAKAKAKK